MEITAISSSSVVDGKWEKKTAPFARAAEDTLSGTATFHLEKEGKGDINRRDWQYRICWPWDPKGTVGKVSKGERWGLENTMYRAS